jgi:hypothetical protein
MEGLIEGRIVHVVMTETEQGIKHRPAIIVKVWNQETGCCNLQVFPDGSNDGPSYGAGIFWATSYVYDPNGDKPCTWHWIEKA